MPVLGHVRAQEKPSVLWKGLARPRGLARLSGARLINVQHGACAGFSVANERPRAQGHRLRSVCCCLRASLGWGLEAGLVVRQGVVARGQPAPDGRDLVIASYCSHCIIIESLRHIIMQRAAARQRKSKRSRPEACLYRPEVATRPASACLYKARLSFCRTGHLRI